ncbi:hypothetical protein [Actinophytocola gossypii]|uniref:DksA C4-type domain-containing protein n=1 Tax=Actinophytocola gossypii TaxID=2812003 RepID=A0ABT2J7R7_9PSEU|nr:hypothetical protein [Actinophytocola gossypii]MCT2583887.1 hypothetical protein [Actinophytocola gossypii]
MNTNSIRSSWITAQEDGTEHAVTDVAQEAARDAGDGRYEAECGTVLLAAAMEAAPLHRCARCRTIRRARFRPRELAAPQRRSGWLSRLCHRGRPAERTTGA